MHNKDMKNYQKIPKFEGARNMPSLLPQVDMTTTPPLNQDLVCVFDNTGKYLGWITPRVAELYLYGSIYYHTDRAYSLKSIKQTRKDKTWDREVNKYMHVIEKRSRKVAIAFAMRQINDWGNLDLNSKLDKANWALAHEVPEHPITIESISADSGWVTIMDQFGFCKHLPKQLSVDVRNLIIDFNKRRALAITNVRDAELVLEKASQETGMRVDI